jgi:hypothetical protein
MSLAACSKKAPDQTGTVQSTEKTVEASEKTVTEPSATVSTIANPAFEFIKTKVDRITVAGEVDEDGDKEEDEVLSYYVPELLIKSSYAESVNKEINAAYEKYKKNLKNEELEQFYGTSYIAYLTKEGVLSLVFISYGEYELNEYKIYNIDTKTGEKVENAKLAEIAGVSNIRKTAMDALQNLYNKMEIFKIKDYKVVLEKGEKKDEQMRDIEKTFSEKYLNDKMQIGITNEGKMFFVSTIDTTAGAEFYNWIYDVDGTTLDDEDNPYWVGDRFPDEEDEDDEDEDEDFDEGDEAGDDDAFPDIDDDEDAE